MSPTLHGSLPLRPGRLRPCVWCTEPTDVTYVPEFRPELGPVPLHSGCAAWMIFVWHDIQAGRKIEAADQERLERLTSGHYLEHELRALVAAGDVDEVAAGIQDGRWSISQARAAAGLPPVAVTVAVLDDGETRDRA